MSLLHAGLGVSETPMQTNLVSDAGNAMAAELNGTLATPAELQRLQATLQGIPTTEEQDQRQLQVRHWTDSLAEIHLAQIVIAMTTRRVALK